MKYILLILYTYFKHKLYTSSFCLLPWGTSLRHSMFPFVGTKKVQIIYDFLKLFLKFHSLHKFCFDPWITLLKIISIKHSENTSQASVSLLPKSPLLVQESHMFPALPSSIENLAWFLLVWSFLFAHKSKSYYYHTIFSSVMFYSVWYMGTITLYVRILKFIQVLQLFELGGQGTSCTTGNVTSLTYDMEVETIDEKAFSTHQLTDNKELNSTFSCVTQQLTGDSDYAYILYCEHASIPEHLLLLTLLKIWKILHGCNFISFSPT